MSDDRDGDAPVFIWLTGTSSQRVLVRVAAVEMVIEGQPFDHTRVQVNGLVQYVQEDFDDVAAALVKSVG